MKLTNAIYLNESKDLQDIFLSSLRDFEIYNIFKILAQRNGNYLRMQAKYSILDNEMDEAEAEAIFRSFRELKKKGISTDMTYSGRNKKLEKKGKYVLVGDIYAYFIVALVNVCRDQKKYAMAEKRGGGKVIVTPMEASYSEKYPSVANFLNSKDQQTDEYLLRKATLETLGLSSTDEDLALFAKLKIYIGMNISEIRKEMSISYAQYMRLDNRLKEVSMAILS